MFRLQGAVGLEPLPLHVALLHITGERLRARVRGCIERVVLRIRTRPIVISSKHTVIAKGWLPLSTEKLEAPRGPLVRFHLTIQRLTTPSISTVGNICNSSNTEETLPPGRT